MSNSESETPSQYNQLIDKQTWAFIEQTNQWYPPDTIDFSMQKQRKIYDAMCSQFHTDYPAGITAVNNTIDSSDYNIPVRRYTSEHKASQVRVVYFHGGGFVVGGLESHDDICAEICAATRLDVTAIDYRLAPEYLHPCAFNDSLASVLHEHERCTSPLILCGDSAGGNLAAAVCHTLRDSETTLSASGKTIAGQVLIYPGLGGDMTTGSYITHANAPMLTTRDVEFYSSIRTGGNYNRTQNTVTLAPLLDNNFANLPETVTFSAQCDPLADDAEAYVAAIKTAGGKASWYNEEGLVHGYLRARHSVDKAKNSFNRITDNISRLASNCELKL